MLAHVGAGPMVSLFNGSEPQWPSQRDATHGTDDVIALAERA